MKRKILLSGLGGSLFPYLHEQLKAHYEVYYVDSDASLLGLYPDYNFFAAPNVTDQRYPSFIKELVTKYGIELYAPLIDEEIEVAHKIQKELPSLTLLSPKLDFCLISMRKHLLMKALKEYGISTIATWVGTDFRYQEGTTVFVKPISGRGSRGIRKISSQQELEAYYILEKYSPNEIMVQEYIEGTEYTVGALINELDEVLCISTRKIIKKKGITIKAVTENNALIEAAVHEINRRFKPKGPINVQLYLTPSNEIKIFEINPRFSTTTVMSYEAGIDEIGLWWDYKNKPFASEVIRPREGIVLHRRWENVFYEQR